MPTFDTWAHKQWQSLRASLSDRGNVCANPRRTETRFALDGSVKYIIFNDYLHIFLNSELTWIQPNVIRFKLSWISKSSSSFVVVQLSAVPCCLGKITCDIFSLCCDWKQYFFSFTSRLFFRAIKLPDFRLEYRKSQYWPQYFCLPMIEM